MLKPDYALAEQVSFNDPDITASYEMYDSPKGNGDVRGYVVRPSKASGKLPAVLVTHENRGLNPYIEDVARRVATAGFTALAPDGLTLVGCVGFCYGGGVCNALAVAYPELNASVPFCSRQAKAEDVSKIQAPLFIHYGELDKRINAGAAAYDAALKANGKTFETHFYANANHGFHNDSTLRSDEANAELAWTRTVDWFNKHLT